MSYSCSISFKKMDAKDVFPFLKEFKKYLDEHMEEVAKENFHYCPIFRKRIETAPKMSELPKEELEEAKNWVMNGIFKFRYFYDNERGQLGIYGVPGCADKLFDGSVYFQNSTDQDYTRKEYEGIKEFEEIFDHWYSMDEKTFFTEYYKKYGQSLDREYMDEEEKGTKRYEEKFEYIKRSMIYDEIWRPISDTLFDDESALYLSLYGSYDISKQYAFIRHCYNEQEKWEEDFYKRYPEEKPRLKDEVGDNVLEER